MLPYPPLHLNAYRNFYISHMEWYNQHGKNKPSLVLIALAFYYFKNLPVEPAPDINSQETSIAISIQKLETDEAYERNLSAHSNTRVLEHKCSGQSEFMYFPDYTKGTSQDKKQLAWAHSRFPRANLVISSSTQTPVLQWSLCLSHTRDVRDSVRVVIIIHY